ncbi:beta-lactamase family protein [Novosphingobium sp. 1949]|uniref:Beta-lactamase family protein n=1 Tax=Novosphingobium organovorum TaxID=2930092 RepID=A0ABT0BEY8_9SPHN|nr:serine hydrolase domain-containing protein [Novosphingobium organovorum]MCJ2183548.1 beta-lactamase family protein [Novosphingobium organovorum]
MIDPAAFPLTTRLDRRGLLALGAAAGLSAAALPGLARAASDRDLLPHVRAVLARWTGPGRFPGMVASLGLPGREPHYALSGTQGFTQGTPMGPDSLFRIYSMTKPITGMAVMQLIDDGLLGLDQPLYDILPAFRHMQVQDSYDGSITALHPAPRPITIRHLLTHTGGIGYAIVQKGPIKALMEEKGLIAGQVSRLKLPGVFDGTPVGSLALFADRLASVPLVADPGTRWSYSMGFDLLGRVIEVVSGLPFARYLGDVVLGPAGMTSTFFQVPASQAHRMTTNYGALGQGLVPIDEGQSSIFLDPPPFAFGGSGLVSSPRDYDRFLRLLAQFGKLDGRRVLGELAVRVGTANLLPEGVAGPVTKGRPSHFGAGGRVGLGSEAGMFGWSGAAGTVGMVDMARGLRSQIFVQFMPPDATTLLPEFQSALKADVTALVENH